MSSPLYQIEFRHCSGVLGVASYQGINGWRFKPVENKSFDLDLLELIADKLNQLTQITNNSDLVDFDSVMCL